MDKEITPEKMTGFMKQIQVLLILVLAAAVGVPLMASTLVTSAVNRQMHKLAAPAEVAEHGQGEMVFYAPMEFLVNLADTAENHYLRVTISLGASLPETMASGAGKKKASKGGHGGGHGGGSSEPDLFGPIKSQEPMVRDTIISVISGYTLNTLASVHGKDELKEQLKTRLQKQLHIDQLAVFFTSFTLQ